MNQDKEVYSQPLVVQPAKRVHHDYDNYLCDNQLIQTYPVAKSGRLNNCNKSCKLISRGCYEAARINDSLFAHAFEAKLCLSSSDDLNRISQIYCKGTIRSICPIPHTSLEVALTQTEGQYVLVIADFENVRCKRYNLHILSNSAGSMGTLLKEDLLVLIFKTRPSQLIKLKGKTFESFQIEISSEIGGSPHNRIKPLTSFCYVANSTIMHSNTISLNDLETFRCERQIEAEGDVYCFARYGDNLVAVGGSYDKILFYDRRVNRYSLSLEAKEGWVGDIIQISENRILYSDWDKLVDADMRMGMRAVYRDNQTGIWNISLLNQSRVLTWSSDPLIQLYQIK